MTKRRKIDDRLSVGKTQLVFESTIHGLAEGDKIDKSINSMSQKKTSDDCEYRFLSIDR